MPGLTISLSTALSPQTHATWVGTRVLSAFFMIQSSPHATPCLCCSLSRRCPSQPRLFGWLHVIITCLLVCSPPGRSNPIFSICSRCVCSGLGAWGLSGDTDWMLQTQEAGVTSHSATRSTSLFPPPAAHLALFTRRGEDRVLPEQLPAPYTCQHKPDFEWTAADLEVFWMLT